MTEQLKPCTQDGEAGQGGGQSPVMEEAWQVPSMEEIAAHRRDRPKTVINVGGARHEVTWRVLERRPLTRLGMLG